MDSEASTRFIHSLTAFLHSLVNGCISYTSGVQVQGHIILSVDSGGEAGGGTIDYILNERLCKTQSDNVAAISHSYHSLPPRGLGVSQELRLHPPKKVLGMDASLTPIKQEVDSEGEHSDDGPALPTPPRSRGRPRKNQGGNPVKQENSLVEKLGFKALSSLKKGLHNSVKKKMGLSSAENQHMCDVCGKSFAHLSSLRVHRKLHSGERPFKCQVCGVAFKQSHHLTTHFRKHTGEKPYQCEFCGGEFSRNSDLKSHIRKHTGEKPYTCDICGETFTYNSHLRYHKMKHTGERPVGRRRGRCNRGLASDLLPLPPAVRAKLSVPQVALKTEPSVKNEKQVKGSSVFPELSSIGSEIAAQIVASAADTDRKLKEKTESTSNDESIDLGDVISASLTSDVLRSQEESLHAAHGDLVASDSALNSFSHSSVQDSQENALIDFQERSTGEYHNGLTDNYHSKETDVFQEQLSETYQSSSTEDFAGGTYALKGQISEFDASSSTPYIPVTGNQYQNTNTSNRFPVNSQTDFQTQTSDSDFHHMQQEDFVHYAHDASGNEQNLAFQALREHSYPESCLSLRESSHSNSSHPHKAFTVYPSLQDQ